MREVSCRACDPFFQAADRVNVPRAALAAGLAYPQAHLENRHERIEWDTFREFMANVERYFDRDQLKRIGAQGLAQPGFRAFALVGRTLFSPTGFYRWMLSSGGLGNQLFSNMMPRFREIAPGQIELELLLAPGYEACPAFFYFAAGGFQAVPELLGLDQAVVRMVELDRGARFDIRFPARPSRRAWLLQRLTRSSDAKATAAELNDAIHTLEQRYDELDRARAEIDRQRRLIDMAYKIGQLVWGVRDVANIGAIVSERLTAVEGINEAGLVVGSPPPDETGDPDFLVVPLPGTPSRGHLAARAPSAPDDARTLLRLLAPTVALAVDNALAYGELEAYQVGLERLVEERTAELRAAQGARERFFANISHEFRTPLSLILLAVEDNIRRFGHLLDERARANFATVSASARKLVRLVDELLVLAASEEAKLALHPAPTDLGALIATLAATWQPAAEAAGLGLATSVRGGVVARVDPVAFERIVTNLVSNAVKYTPAGGMVSLALAVEDGIRVSVTDTGPGIDAELRSRLFGRFERGSTARAGGSGIGLSLVKQLVEAHGGTIEPHERPGGGTEMRVTLPAAALTRDRVAERGAPVLDPADYDAGLEAPIATGSIVAPVHAAAGTILIAEDDARLAAMVARLLGEHYRVVVALDGAAALDLVDRYQPQLLITDIDMPGLDGIELAREFRKAAGDKLAPIIILSAIADLDTRVSGLEAGAIDYVLKPFDARELLARVRSQFTMRELSVRLRRAEQLSAIGNLATGLAHELRNPANGLINAVAPLRERLPAAVTDPETITGKLLEVVAECAEQITFVSRQLLGFKSGGALELREIDLDDIVARALTLAQPALDGLAVRKDLDGVGPIVCSPPLIVQVLANLVENAAHAAGRGGWVEVSSRPGSDRVTIEVADSGPGVPHDLRERVFEAFYTTKPPGAGTGLGLTMAREIIMRHGGVLEVRERQGTTVFAVDLPRLPAPG